MLYKEISKDSSTAQYFSILCLQFQDGKLEKSVKFWYFGPFLWELRWGYNHWSVINVWSSAKILNKKLGYLAWEPQCRYFLEKLSSYLGNIKKGMRTSLIDGPTRVLYMIYDTLYAICVCWSKGELDFLIWGENFNITKCYALLAVRNMSRICEVHITAEIY